MLRSVLAAVCSWLLVPVLASGQSAVLQQVEAVRQNALPGTLHRFHDQRMPRTRTIQGVAQQMPRITRRVDLSQTVAAYAEAKQLPMSQARLDTFMFLGLGPTPTGQPKLEPVKFDKVSTDVFNITGTEGYFRQLPAMRKCLELGKKRVVVHVQTFAVDGADAGRVAQLITPGTMHVHYDQLSPISPIATRDADDLSDFKAFVSTTTVTRKGIPVNTGELSRERHEKLTQLLRQSPQSSLLSNPILSALPGQAATMSTMQYHPFVVGTKGLETQAGKSFTSPTVKAFEQGSMVRVKAIPAAGKIRLMTDIAISQITGVEAFKSTDAAGTRAIQVPSQQIRQVHFAAEIAPGDTILIDTNSPCPEEPSERDGAPREFVVTLTAEVVDLDQGSPQVAAATQELRYR